MVAYYADRIIVVCPLHGIDDDVDSFRCDCRPGRLQGEDPLLAQDLYCPLSLQDKQNLSNMIWLKPTQPSWLEGPDHP